MDRLPDARLAKLFTTNIRAAVDRIIPADSWPAGWDGGVSGYVSLSNLELDWARPALGWLDTALNTAAQANGASSFAALVSERQDAILTSFEIEDDPPGAATHFAALRRICWEGFYASSAQPSRSGKHTPIGLEMVGFRAVPSRVTPVEPDLIEGIRPDQLSAAYDAIVIGRGPGGGVAAETLASAGKTVLLIERSLPLPNAALRGDHLHGKRNAVYAPSAGPGAGHPRLAHLQDDEYRVIDGTGDASLYGLNAMVFGGGTRLWQGMSWRFLPDDFAMASVFGNPDGAGLADWPIDYDEMEPFYTRAEWALGVSGAEGSCHFRRGSWRFYPVPAVE